MTCPPNTYVLYTFFLGIKQDGIRSGERRRRQRRTRKAATDLDEAVKAVAAHPRVDWKDKIGAKKKSTAK
jgi:hypothetical protein